MLLGVIDHFPDEDGAGILLSILYGLESLPGNEPPLLESAELRPTSFKLIMVDLLLRADSAQPRVAADPARRGAFL